MNKDLFFERMTSGKDVFSVVLKVVYLFVFVEWLGFMPGFSEPWRTLSFVALGIIVAAFVGKVFAVKFGRTAFHYHK